MTDADNLFSQATDDLIGLYRTIERRTLDLPWISAMPLLIFFWAVLKFYFFFVVGIFLIVPVNLVILIRNFFPGHWAYRPFFLRHLHYIWLWLWRGEAPTGPFILIRPLLSAFMKWHFERGIRRLRTEIFLNDALSEETRSALTRRLDTAVERWKLPKLPTIFFSVALPAIFGLPSWSQKMFEFLESFGIRLPTNDITNFISQHVTSEALLLAVVVSFAYLLAIPITAFLAKRGLFIGLEPKRICFPGSKDGVGFYGTEKEILARVGLRPHEPSLDLWLHCTGSVVAALFYVATWNSRVQPILDLGRQTGSQSFYYIFLFVTFLEVVLIVAAFFIAVIRRGRTGRA